MPLQCHHFEVREQHRRSETDVFLIHWVRFGTQRFCAVSEMMRFNGTYRTMFFFSMEFKLPFQCFQINPTGVPYLGVPASPHRMLVIRKMTGKGVLKSASLKFCKWEAKQRRMKHLFCKPHIFSLVTKFWMNLPRCFLELYKINMFSLDCFLVLGRFWVYSCSHWIPTPPFQLWPWECVRDPPSPLGIRKNCHS